MCTLFDLVSSKMQKKLFLLYISIDIIFMNEHLSNDYTIIIIYIYVYISTMLMIYIYISIIDLK